MYAASQKETDTALHFPAKYTRFRPVRLSGTLLRAALTAAGEHAAYGREIPAAVTAEQTGDSMRREAHGNQFSKIC